MGAIFYLWRKSPVIVLLAIIAGFLSGAGGIGLLSLITIALSKQHGLSTFLVWGFLGLCALVVITQYFSQMLLTHISEKATFDLRLQLSRQILSVPLRHLETVGAHRLLAMLTLDVIQIAQVATFLPKLCIDFAMVIGCLIYLVWLSWTISLVVFGAALIGIVIYKALENRAMTILEAVREEQDALQKHFQALTEGIKELKLHHYRREDYFSNRLQNTVTLLRQHHVAAAKLFAGAWCWNQIVVYLLIGALLFSPLIGMQAGSPTILGCILTVLFLRGPLEGIIALFPSLGRVGVAVKNIENLGLTLNMEPSNRSATDAPYPKSSCEKLELVGVTHSYIKPEADENMFVLGPLHLSFRRGELVFIAGGNGSGKTTFAKLLAGLYIPEGGEILLDGRAVDDTNRELYRQHFSAIFSDFYLFDTLLGLDGPDLQERAQRYLVQLQLDNKVQISGSVLSTTELSQGQRKRLALLTAYLENRPIYIFDEWAADQDPQFKNVFYHQILPDLKSQNKTVFVISHDDRYYSLADRLIKLEDGQVRTDSNLAIDANHSSSYQKIAASTTTTSKEAS
jgi:putative pyoverdin transport system ATP-binding/permease protein